MRIMHNVTALPSYGGYDENDHEKDTFDLKAPSDIFMMAMIIVMMFCMTFCCLCLFCRRSAEFSLCGINFEVNNDPDAILDELNELHEVLPLTPTDGGPQYPTLDIDSRLKCDSPPPRYSEVDNSAFKWMFKSSAKIRSASTSVSIKTKRSSSLLGSFSRPRFSFRRSRSLNQTQQTSSKVISDSAFPALSEEKIATHDNTTLPEIKDGSNEDFININILPATSHKGPSECSRNYEDDDVFE